MSRGKRLQFFLLVVLLGLMAMYFAFRITSALYGYHKAGRLYDGLSRNCIVKSEENGEFPSINVDFQKLFLENPDCAGWLCFPDGNVNLPIAAETDEALNWYETHAFDGTKSAAGSLFISFDADSDFNDFNTYIYGHNMKNGSMFGSLKTLYNDRALIKEPYFYIWTARGERMKYRVLSLYVADENSSMYAVPLDEAEQAEYLRSILRKGSTKNLFPFTEAEEEAVQKNAPLVTLYTCYGSAGTSRRLFVQGIEIIRESV